MVTGLPLQVKETGPALRYMICAADGFPLAITYGQTGQEGDARLFAAAPDLLAALEYVLLADEYDGGLTMGTAALSPAIRDRLKRAVAQAKGE